MKMTFNFRLFSLLITCLIFSCSSDDDGNNNNGGGGLTPQATYRITFEPNFTDMTHPTDYPANAGFNKMFVMAHSNTSTLYSTGQLASDGFKTYIDSNDLSGLNNEHDQGDDNVNPTVITVGTDVSASQNQVVTLNLTPSTTLISLVSKISPSPDWFVGIDSYNLVNPDNSLVDYAEINVFPLDAGVNAATTYTGDAEAENAAVATISGDPFVGSNGFIQRIGRVIIERID